MAYFVNKSFEPETKVETFHETHTDLLWSITVLSGPCTQSCCDWKVNKTPHEVQLAPSPRHCGCCPNSGYVSPTWESQPGSLTCPHTSHADQPPLREPREHQHHSVSRLQATGTLQHISRLPGLLPQLFKAPLDLCSCTINPPEGRDWRPVASLENCIGKKEMENMGEDFCLLALLFF